MYPFLNAQALAAQFIDRSQLRVQLGLSLKYYDDIAEVLGCYPSLRRLLSERPSALWHVRVPSKSEAAPRASVDSANQSAPC